MAAVAAVLSWVVGDVLVPCGLWWGVLFYIVVLLCIMGVCGFCVYEGFAFFFFGRFRSRIVRMIVMAGMVIPMASLIRTIATVIYGVHEAAADFGDCVDCIYEGLSGRCPRCVKEPYWGYFTESISRTRSFGKFCTTFIPVPGFRTFCTPAAQCAGYGYAIL